jgi:hypothetical protein
MNLNDASGVELRAALCSTQQSHLTPATAARLDDLLSTLFRDSDYSIVSGEFAAFIIRSADIRGNAVNLQYDVCCFVSAARPASFSLFAGRVFRACESQFSVRPVNVQQGFFFIKVAPEYILIRVALLAFRRDLKIASAAFNYFIVFDIADDSLI